MCDKVDKISLIFKFLGKKNTEKTSYHNHFLCATEDSLLVQLGKIRLFGALNTEFNGLYFVNFGHIAQS